AVSPAVVTLARPAGLPVGLLGTRCDGGMTPILDVRDVSFAYDRGSRRVVDGVSLAVPRGAVLGLLGPNGSGKTTLLRLMSGTLTPDAGSVSLDGQPMA